MLKAAVFAAALAFVAVPAQAVVLVLDGGWIDDSVSAVGVPSANSPFTFTIGVDALLRITDAFSAGDTYTVSNASSSILASTTFATDGAAVPDYFGVAWSNVSFSRLSLLLSPGTYSLSITGDCAATCPAGFGVRLDTAPVVVGGVPEPAAWALLIAGFGLTGAVMRRRSAGAQMVSA